MRGYGVGLISPLAPVAGKGVVAMEQPERSALAIFAVGVAAALAGLTAALPFPELPRVVCSSAFFAGVVLIAFAAAFLTYQYRRAARPRWAPFLIGAMVVVLMGLLGAAGYFWPTTTIVRS